MKISLIDLKVGDKVYCDGYSSFCDGSINTVQEIELKFDENTGEKYRVIIINSGQKFDGRTGYPITPPTAYHIEPIEQNETK